MYVWELWLLGGTPIELAPKCVLRIRVFPDVLRNGDNPVPEQNENTEETECIGQLNAENWESREAEGPC
jgi:hypothetical protein